MLVVINDNLPVCGFWLMVVKADPHLTALDLWKPSADRVRRVRWIAA
jgi:hypothetical protein